MGECDAVSVFSKSISEKLSRQCSEMNTHVSPPGTMKQRGWSGDNEKNENRKQTEGGGLLPSRSGPELANPKPPQCWPHTRNPEKSSLSYAAYITLRLACFVTDAGSFSVANVKLKRPRVLFPAWVLMPPRAHVSPSAHNVVTTK